MMITKIKNELKQGKNFLSFSTLKILSQAILFIIPLILANFLAPDGFGAYSLSMMVVYFFTSLLIGSPQTPFVIYANEEFKKTNKINKSFTIQFIFFTGSLFFFFLLTLIFIKPLSNFASITITQFLFLIIAYVGLCIKTSFANVFLALNKKTLNATYEVIYAIISVIYIFVLSYLSLINLENIFLMFFISSILTSFILINKIDFNKIFPLVFDLKLFKKMWNYTKWVMLGGTAVYFINWGDNLVLKYFVSIEEIGVYNLGYQFFKGIITLSAMVNIYFLPYIAQNLNNKKALNNYFYKKRPKIMFLGCSGLVLLFFISPYIFSIFFGSAYGLSSDILRILIVGALFHLGYIFYYPIFNSLKKYKFMQIANIFHVLLNIFLTYIFVIWFGVMGAAIGTSMSYAARFVINEIYFRKYCKNKYVK